MKKTILALAAAAMLASPALADERYAPVAHEATAKECGACHMVFQPQMLPARSWEAIMKGLDDHFGESASLDAAVVADITGFLTANAADAGGKSRWMRGITADQTPLRISETPYWVKEHKGEVRPGAFEDPKVGSKANCVACHKAADKGSYDDD